MSGSTAVVEAAECGCYKCAGPQREWVNGQVQVTNNVHGKLTPCEDCGHLKTEYRDHGRKGVYKCWWCNERAADPGELE